jgi:transcriptional regulator with XRE-family HTH domain
MAFYAVGTDATYGEFVEDQDQGMRTAWADFLRLEADRRKLTINGLAKLLPVNRATFFRWLKGTVQPDLSSVRLVAEVLDVDLATALRAAGKAADATSGDDWEIQMIRDSGLHPKVIERLVENALNRRERERASRREELEREIDLLRESTS